VGLVRHRHREQVRGVGVEPVDDGGAPAQQGAEALRDALADHVWIEPLGQEPADAGQGSDLMLVRPLLLEEPRVLLLERSQAGEERRRVLRIRVALGTRRWHPIVRQQGPRHGQLAEMTGSPGCRQAESVSWGRKMSTPVEDKARRGLLRSAHRRQPSTSSRSYAAMTTDPKMINHLWTHKTQDHPFLSDEELVIDRGEGVWVWTEQGKKLLDGFAGLAVVNVGHGRREIAEAIAEQTVRLAYYPTTRQFSNRPAAELAEKIASITPGDLRYTMFAVSGSEANERSMQIARQYWLAAGKSRKHKVISLQGGYHGATMGTFAVCGLPHLAQAYQPLEVPGFVKVAPPHPF